MTLVWLGLLKAGWGIMSMGLTVKVLDSFWEAIMSKSLTDHIVIVGWNKSGERIAKDLDEQNKNIKIFGFGPEVEISEASRESYEKVSSIDGIVMHKDFKRCKSIIVLADDKRAEHRGDSDVDLWVSRVVRRMRKAIEENHQENVHIVAEVRRGANKEIVLEGGADEVICIETFGAELLAHAATKKRISVVFDNLIGTTETSNEIYYDAADLDSYSTFSDALIHFANHRDGLAKTPIGIKREGAILLNPRSDECALEEGDELIVIRMALAAS